MFNHENEKRFFKMLDLAPELKRFWDEKEGSMKPKSVTSELKMADKKESALFRFFISVWMGNSDYADFDFIECVKLMDDREIKIVRKWLVDPFFC
ncbi:hypothetical protein OA92_10065 [Marinomonas sp. SBI22]|uniref:hypothetical protein n=1 Tax=unclassified Marinomonas TaxID=196814 RepID=UPI0007AEF238|nr:MULTISPECIES: hypothetical protein [unclassified Marinomonas]KZM43095.1 hypothetical protein OA92_10065 [Marinomonas sp. SBI22]KZM44666.1 hypothetical protein OA91_09490 [Marinomonas sp. SBI8L]